MTRPRAPDEPAGPATVAAARPLDPRSRAVIATVPLKASTLELHLECGHVVRRRVAFCAPARVICTTCPGPGRSRQDGAATEAARPGRDSDSSV